MIESKEKSSPTRVGAELLKIGGLGDILHMAKITGNLANQEGFQVDVYSDDVTDKYLGLCLSEFGNVSIVSSADPKQIEPDILITHALPITERSGRLARIHIEEFSHQEQGPPQQADYIVSTGLGFNSTETSKIQAGITDSITLKNKLEQRVAIKQETRVRLNRLLEKAGIAEKVGLKHARIGFLYTSTLSTNFSYIEGLSKVATQINEPIVIFCIASSPEGYRVGAYEKDPTGKRLRALLKDAPVSFYDIEDEDSIKYDKSKESGVSIINLGSSVEYDLFQNLLLSVDFPSVVTGDQSLAEAIQMASIIDDAPPFLYYCYFGEKPKHFLERMNQTSPLAAAIAVDFILRENIPNNSQDILPVLRDIQNNTGKQSFENIFTDRELQKEYARAMAMIPENMRKEKIQHIPMGDKLVWESDTINFIVDCIRRGEEEKIDLLMPPKIERVA